MLTKINNAKKKPNQKNVPNKTGTKPSHHPKD